MRAQTALESAAQQTITTTVLRKFAATARQRMRIEGGGYRRDHLRALAHSVEVADREVRIMGSKSDLLRRLAAISGVKSATGGVRSSVLDWRRECLHKKQKLARNINRLRIYAILYPQIVLRRVAGLQQSIANASVGSLPCPGAELPRTCQSDPDDP
jgi:hypothetical protein